MCKLACTYSEWIQDQQTIEVANLKHRKRMPRMQRRIRIDG